MGQQPAPTKHFNQKKKPKSAYLRSELLQKSNDVASNLKKASAPVIPVRSRGMPRKMTDTTPLKGIPSRVPSSGFRSSSLTSPTVGGRPLPRTPAGRKDGGIKLLDIADQPLGYAQAKKRKKMQEMEEAKKTAEQATTPTTPVSGATPDYAAGLSTTPAYTPSASQPATPVKETRKLFKTKFFGNEIIFFLNSSFYTNSCTNSVYAYYNSSSHNSNNAHNYTCHPIGYAYSYNSTDNTCCSCW